MQANINSPYLCSVLILLFGWIGAAEGQELLEANQWEVFEYALEVEGQEHDPLGADVLATFTHSQGLQFEIQAFWNGGSEYLVRFSPPQTGVWKMHVETPTSSLLERRLHVEPAKIGARGGIRINSEDPTRFAHENGEPYYPIAFECDWLFALDAENEVGTPRTEQLVETIAASGFNQVVMNVYAYDVNWKKDPKLKKEHEFGSPRVFPFGGTNLEPNHSRLNVSYFQRFDRVIELLQEKEIVAHLMIYVWNKQVNWPEASSKEDNRYFDYVVKRYQAYPNLVWDVSKEALGYGHNDVNYITDRIRRLRKLDAHQRLVTVHDYSYCRRFPDELDFVSVQIWSSELYGVMRDTVESFPQKPVLNIEHGGYERGPYRVFVGDYTSAETCLERAYQCVFAGVYPTHYWQGSSWNVVISDISTLPESERPKLGYYRHLSDLVHKYHFDELKAGLKKSNSGFCLTNEQNLFLYYVPKENDSINLRLPKEHRGKRMRGTWFDPFQGTFSESEEKEVVQWPDFETPDREGFSVLIVEILNDAVGEN